MQKATLGGVEGVADVRYRYRTEFDREWRGTFVFRAEDEPAIARLADGGLVPFEMATEGERQSLTVKIVSVTSEGYAFFEAVEPNGSRQQTA